MLTVAAFQSIFKRLNIELENPISIFQIAYSGGVDSHVLLHVCQQLRLIKPNLKLQAVHIHHGLSSQADSWAQHCQKVCISLAIPCQIIYVDAKAKLGESPEAAARQARYQALANVLLANDYLLTAHHQDDQAETLLLQLLRGAGVTGLAAMPMATSFHTGQLIRPLLDFSRTELLTYAEQHSLSWIEDESNQQLHFDRNYLRQQIIPVLKQRWPQSVRTIARSATHCAAAAELNTTLAELDLAVCLHHTASLNIDKLMQLTIMRRQNVIRYWLQTLSLDIPNTVHLQQLEATVLLAAKATMPKLQFAKTVLRRYRNMLYADTTQELPAVPNMFWDLMHPLVLPNKLGSLAVTWQQGQGLRQLTEAELGQIHIRGRRKGELFHPVGRSGKHPLKKLLQEWGVPPWQRQAIPLICCADQILAIPNYAISAAYQAAPNQQGWNVNWQHSLDLGSND